MNQGETQAAFTAAGIIAGNDKRLTPFGWGVTAHMEGRGRISGNPHQPGTTAHDQWDEGWMEREAIIHGRDAPAAPPAASRSPAFEAAPQAVSDLPASAPAAPPQPHSVFFAQIGENDWYATPLLLRKDSVSVPHWPLRHYDTEPEQSDYIEGILAGHLDLREVKCARKCEKSRAYIEGWMEGATVAKTAYHLNYLGQAGWRGCIMVEDHPEQAYGPGSLGDFFDSALEGNLDETWTAERKTLAGKIIIALGMHPQFADLDTKVMARGLRHAATYLAPEVPLHDMDPALEFYDRVKAVYDCLDASYIQAIQGASLDALGTQVDDLAVALDRIEEEMAPYIAERAKRQAAKAPIGATTDQQGSVAA